MVLVPNIVVPVPQGCGVPVHFWYQYHTYWYQYQHAISAGLEQNLNLGARACSSLTTTLRLLMRILFKPLEGRVKEDQIIGFGLDNV